MTKKRAKNRGEIPQYYIEFSHPAIIEPKEFDAVQVEIKRRKALGNAYSSNNIFSSKIVCGDCGHFFGSKVWHSTSKYRRTVFQCNNKFKNEEGCKTPHLDETVIKEAFVIAYNKMMSENKTLLDDCRIMQKLLTNTTSLDAKIEALTQELQELEILVKQLITANKTTAMNQEEYEVKYTNLESRYVRADKALKDCNKQREERLEKAENIGAFMFAIREYDVVLTEFDEDLWLSIVDCVVVHSTRQMVFKFRGGIEITV